MSIQTVTNVKTSKEVDVLAGIPLQVGYSPRPPEKTRMIVAGFPGSFKSSFCASNPHAVLLDFDNGTAAIQKAKATIVKLNPDLGDPDVSDEWKKLTIWQRYIKARDQILAASRNGNRPFRTVIWDTTDAMNELIIRNVCRDAGVDSPGDYGGSNKGSTGWYKVRDAMMSEFDLWNNAGFGIWMPLHLREKQSENATVVSPWLQDSTLKALWNVIDQVIQIEMASVKVPAAVRRDANGKICGGTGESTKLVCRVKTSPGGAMRGVKSRVMIPDGLELDLNDPYTTWASAYDAEVDRIKTELGGAVVTPTPETV